MISSPIRTFAASLLCAVIALGATDIPAQSWPDKPVKILVPAPAGSSLDVLARTIGDKLKDKYNQPVVVENKPAAGGTVATAELARSAPDGHTLLLGFPGPLSTGPMIQKVPYDVARDLAPVVITSNQPSVLAVNASLPIRNVAELAAWAKANPGKLNYASVGNGSSSHLNAEILKSVGGFDATHVPFNGSPPAVLSTVQGETQMIFAVMQPLQAQIQAGKLRAIGVTTAQRFRLMPDIPAIAETHPGFEAAAWNGIVAPAATPPEVVRKIAAEVSAIFRMPDVAQKLNGLGFELIGGTPEDFAKLLADERARWAPVVQRLGLKVD